MKIRSLANGALVVLVLGASACGAATDVETVDVPTTIPLLDSTESTETALADTTESTDLSTTTEAEPATSVADESSTTTSGAQTTTTPTTAGTTSTTADPNAPYCAAAVDLAELEASASPSDPGATEALVTAQEQAWIGMVPLAPSVISSEVVAMRDFTTAFRAILAEYEYDVAAAFPDLVELENEMEIARPRILTDQFGMLECEVEPTTPEEETAVFYASMLDTSDRRTVLAELLSNDEDVTLEGARCLVERMTVDMVFPLAEAPSTDEQTAALNQALGVCQLSTGGS